MSFQNSALLPRLRRDTSKFIAVAPSVILMEGYDLQPSPLGGTRLTPNGPRMPITVTMSENSSSLVNRKNNPEDGSTPGRQDTHEYIVLGTYDADIRKYDEFNFDGYRYQITSVMLDNGYEKRATAVRRNLFQVDYIHLARVFTRTGHSAWGETYSDPIDIPVRIGGISSGQTRGEFEENTTTGQFWALSDYVNVLTPDSRVALYTYTEAKLQCAIQTVTPNYDDATDTAWRSVQVDVMPAQFDDSMIPEPVGTFPSEELYPDNNVFPSGSLDG